MHKLAPFCRPMFNLQACTKKESRQMNATHYILICTTAADPIHRLAPSCHPMFNLLVCTKKESPRNCLHAIHCIAISSWRYTTTSYHTCLILKILMLSMIHCVIAPILAIFISPISIYFINYFSRRWDQK